jgi:hypothetical protein
MQQWRPNLPAGNTTIDDTPLSAHHGRFGFRIHSLGSCFGLYSDRNLEEGPIFKMGVMYGGCAED